MYLAENSQPLMEICQGKPAYKAPKRKKSPKDNRGLIGSTTAWHRSQISPAHKNKKILATADRHFQFTGILLEVNAKIDWHGLIEEKIKGGSKNTERTSHCFGDYNISLTLNAIL